jgi:hypothetical protein
MSDQEKYKKAEKIVEAKLGFLRHLIVYLAVNAFLLIINLLTSPSFMVSVAVNRLGDRFILSRRRSFFSFENVVAQRADD